MRRGSISRLAVVILLGCHVASAADERAALGRALFFDANLSLNRTQSCSTCHDSDRAFSDGRDNGVSRAVSLGDDGVSLGDRNAPALTYASLIPTFHRNEKGEYVGGFFLDGRAATLVEQSAEPFTNPIEMALPNPATVVARVRENASHVSTLEKIYGPSVFDDPAQAFQAITESIAAFEQTELFSPFDSKYDRSLRGKYELTQEEELGRVLFFSQLGSCHRCHLLNTEEFTTGEAFTTHRYHNIGIPAHAAVRKKNDAPAGFADVGLLQNPTINDPAAAGKFRVPSLRNVAVTGPYMHNGIFEDLLTAVLFYNTHMLSSSESQVNPETGEPWGEAEVPETIDFERLRSAQPMSPRQAKALVAFLTTLTDRRYESLLAR